MKQYIVDAFTAKPFSGNPAAISGEAAPVAVSEIMAEL